MATQTAPDPRADLDPALRVGLGPIVYSREQIEARVAQMAAAISRDYAGKQLVLIGVLKGIVLFMADLLRELAVPAAVDFIAISRFGPPQESRGAVRLLKDLDLPLAGRHALLVENIVDTGFTMSYLMRALHARHPASLAVCVLLDRSRRRLIDVELDYVGFEAPEDFLVGYGLGHHERYRQLPFIARFDPQDLPAA